MFQGNLAFDISSPEGFEEHNLTTAQDRDDRPGQALPLPQLFNRWANLGQHLRIEAERGGVGR
jgi:hypothetical protein